MMKKILLISTVVLVIAIYISKNKFLSDEELASSLRGKVVVLCGASSGIGEEAAYRYAKAGAKLILSARSVDKLEKVKSKCTGAGSVDVIVQDFSKIDELESYAQKVLAIHPTVDILVLNHAAMPASPWLGTPPQQVPSFTDRVFKINVISFIELTRLFMPHLEASSGQIHVTSSVSGFLPFFRAGLYTSTKHALNGFYKSLQQELLLKESPVTVSIFSFGLIVTEELTVLLSRMKEGQKRKIPEFMKGDLGEAAQLMLSAAVTRPEDVDYPWASNKLSRFLNTFTSINKVLTAGMDYDETVESSEEAVKISKEMGYQKDNRV